MNTPAQVAENYLSTGKAKVSLPFGRMLALAILAGIYIALAGLNASAVTWAGLASNLIPVTLGNILGGAGLGLAYWYIYLKKPKA